MSKIKEIYFEKIRNLGNYENVKIGVKILVDEKDDPNERFTEVKEFVENKLLNEN